MVALTLGRNSVSQKLVNKYGDLVGLYQYEWTEITIVRVLTTSKLVYKVRDGTKLLDLVRDQVLHIPKLSMDGVIGLAYSGKCLGTKWEQCKDCRWFCA